MKNKIIELLTLSIYLGFNLTHAAAVDDKRQLSEVTLTFENYDPCVERISDDRFATYSFRKIQPIRIWDIKTGVCIGQLDGHKNIVSNVIALDDNTLVFVDGSGLIKVFDLTSFKEKRSLQSQLTGDLILLKLDNNRFILQSLGETEIWDLSLDDRDAMIRSFDHNGIVPLNNNRIAIFSNDHLINIFNIENRELETLTQNCADTNQYITHATCLTDNIMVLSLYSREYRYHLNVIDIGSENIVKQRIKQSEHTAASLKIDDHNILVGYKNGQIKKLCFIDYETPPRETLIFKTDDDERVITFVDLGINRIAALSFNIITERRIIRIFNLDLNQDSLEEALVGDEYIIRLCNGRFVVWNKDIIQVREFGLGWDLAKSAC